MAVISKNLKLSYLTSGSGTNYTDLTNLLEVPDLGGSVDSIEITTLSDAAHTYTNGLKNYGDSVEFKFLYEAAQFNALRQILQTSWKVTLPDGASCTFSGASSVRLDGVGVNAALTYTLSIKPSSEMIWTAAS